MINKIFLDVDGVLANFTKAACEQCRISYPTSPKEIEDKWLDNQTKNILWKYCRGHDFWANIESFPWAQELVFLINNSKKQWVFLTKPSSDSGCYSGKHQWIKKHFGVETGTKHLWIINGTKSLACSGSDCLLIDDNTKNCNEWVAQGGSLFKWHEVTPDWPKNQISQRIESIKALIT